MPSLLTVTDQLIDAVSLPERRCDGFQGRRWISALPPSPIGRYKRICDLSRADGRDGDRKGEQNEGVGADRGEYGTDRLSRDSEAALTLRRELLDVFVAQLKEIYIILQRMMVV